MTSHTRRSHLLLVSLLLGMLLAGAIGFCAEPGLLFHVSYNGQTEKANFAAGKAESLNFSRTLQYLQAPGVISAGFQTLDNERCDYAMPGNFDPRQGSLNLWVRAENWRATDPRGYAFFVAEIPSKYKLVLAKPAAEPVLALEITGAAPLKSPALNWQPTEWHQIVVTWSAESVKLYVDGGLVGEAKGAAFPAAEANGVFSINPNHWFKEPASSPADKTSVDEVKLYSTVLMPEQIRREFTDLKTQLTGGVYRRPRLTIPFRKAAPTLDGKLAPGEWDTAVKVPMLCHMGKHEIPNRVGHVMLMYDADHLHLAFHATGVKEPLTKYKERDSWVWEDSAIEFIWETAEPSRARFQVVINSINTIYDMKNGDAKWNGVTRSAAGLDGDGWSAEVALSFKDLGIEPPKPGVIWTGNFMHDWDQRIGGFATWAYSMTADGFTMNFGNSDVFGSLAFGDDEPAVRLESLGDLVAGKVDARITLGETRSVASASADGADGAASSTTNWTTLYRLSSEQVPAKESTTPLTASAPLGKDSLLAITVSDAAGRSRFVYDQQFQPKPPILLSYKCWPHLRRLDVTLDLSNAGPVPAEGWRGELALADADGKQTLSKVPVTMTNVVSVCALPFPKSLPPGMYAVRASVGSFQQSKLFQVPPDDEVNSTAGIDHTVPAPWTPVAVSGKTVKMIDREYTLGRSPFPVRMQSLGDDVLAQPVDWIVTTSRGEERVQWDAPRIGKRFDDVVTFTGRGRLRKAGIQFRYESQLEFDGLWLTKVTMTPPKSGAIEIQSMRLEYEVATPGAAYVRAPLLRPWENDRVLLDLFESIDEVASSRAPMGHFWVTSLRSGLHFLTPTDGNWVYQKGKPNVRIERAKTTASSSPFSSPAEGRGEPSGPTESASHISSPLGGEGRARGGVDSTNDVAKVTVLLIHKPVTLRQPSTYTLGLTATPSRPLPRRSWNAGEHEWIFQPGKWKSWISLVPRDPDGLRKGVEEKRKKGFRFFYQYSCAYVLGDNSGYENYWGPTWAGRQPMSGESFGGCPNSGIRHVVVAHVERLAREFGIGPYFDMFGIDWCDNAVHGCGYTDSFGRAAKTTSLPGLREQMKRIYRLTHRHNCRVFSHNHTLFVVPVHGFSDLWLPGEQYTTAMFGRFENFYTHHVPRTDWLVEMNPFPQGVQMVFIPENARSSDLGGDKNFERWFTEPYAWATEQMLTMVLPHDIAFCLANVTAAPGQRVIQVFRERGIALREDDPRPDAIFTGYWSNPAITTDDPAVLLSYYTRPDSPDVLAVLSNPSAQDKTVRLRLKSDRYTIRDEYRDEDLPQWPAGITVPRQNFRLLWIRPAPVQ